MPDPKHAKSVVRSAQAKELLKGILDTDIHSNCALITQHAGPLMILNISYEDMRNKLGSYDMSAEGQSNFIEVETFQWTGQRHSEAFTHRKSIRIGWILEVVEVTQEQWDAHLTEQVARQAQATNS